MIFNKSPFVPVMVCISVLPCSVFAALSLTDLNPVTENFNSFDGTASTVPTNFTTGGAFTFGTPGRTLTSGTSAYDATTGWYALNDNNSLSDIAFGGRTNATDGEGTLTVEVVNNTGMTIPGLSLNFQVEQYTDSKSGNQLDVLASLDNSAFNTTNLTGDLSTNIPGDGTGNQVFSNPTITSASVGYDTSIANGDSVYLRFFWNQISGGNRPHFGIDDFSVQVVPEPSVTLLGLLGIGLLFRRRR